MASIYGCSQAELVEKSSGELRKNGSIKPPKWAAFAKTGVHKEKPPIRDDWWYTRAASVLRQVYRHGPIGVSKLRTKYGGKKDRGYKTEHFFKGSGNILRKILQQLEAAGFVKKEEKSVHKGRVITAEGKKFLDEIAAKISPIKIKEEKRAKEPKEGIEETEKHEKKAKAKRQIKPKEAQKKEKEGRKEKPGDKEAAGREEIAIKNE